MASAAVVSGPDTVWLPGHREGIPGAPGMWTVRPTARGQVSATGKLVIPGTPGMRTVRPTVGWQAGEVGPGEPVNR